MFSFAIERICRNIVMNCKYTGVRNLKFCRVLFIGIAISTMLVGCATLNQDVTVDQNSFHLLSEKNVQFDMQQMAINLSAILGTTLDETASVESQSASIVPILDKIQRIAYELGGEGLTNYSVINRYMGAFLYDVGIAREFALRSPPNLVPAGRLVKSCMSCHDSF
jgi:hypothetical protein